jgi:hypothetical protein
MKKRIVNGLEVELKQGRLFVEGKYCFLKIGKPLRDFSNKDEVEQLIKDLDVIRGKNYNCIELNCYWHHLDPEGSGLVGVDIEPLSKLIDEINSRGMFAALSVETYGVGGGQIPEGFWERHPEALAVGIEGETVKDTEYGYMSRVPSLYSEDYRRVSRAYITDLASQLDPYKILYYETTVEPQYMGDVWIDYSPEAKKAYTEWAEDRHPNAQPFPHNFPIPREFICDPVWNRFRAEWLAAWVCGDAAAFRAGAGDDVWVASEYLDADEPSMLARCGDPVVFLTGLETIDIIQVNWHWHLGTRAPNLKAYQRVKNAMELTGRDWAITEHMTINGTDYRFEEMHELLVSTIRNGTQFGWEFVDIAADPDGPDIAEGSVRLGDFKPAHFSVYDRDWNPKPAMSMVDDNWDYWMTMINQAVGVSVPGTPPEANPFETQGIG